MASRPKAKWGDRTQRRVDILDAAREEAARRGYLEFSMRAVAAGAGVSPATLYAYFTTKEEIFAALYGERLEALHEEVLELVGSEDDLERFLVRVAAAYRPVYAEYGHAFDLWSLTRPDNDELPSYGALVAEPATRIMVTIAGELDRLGAFDGVDPEERALVLPFLWAFLTGVSDHFTGSRHLLHPYSFDELTAFAVRRLVRALR